MVNMSNNPTRIPFEQRLSSSRFRLTRLAVCTLTVLAGCASTDRYSSEPDLEPGRPMALIHVVRPTGAFGMAISAPVSVNGNLIGRLGPGGHLQTPVSAGRIRVTSTTNTATVQADPNGEYFFEVTMPMQMWAYAPDFTVAAISREKGRSYLSDGEVAQSESRPAPTYASSSSAAPSSTPAAGIAPRMQYEAPQGAPSQGPSVSAIGEWSFGAERVAKSASCNSQPIARLTGKGPGFETFALTCTNGDVMNVRCDRGQCRALR